MVRTSSIFMLSLVRSAAAQRREKQKFGVFVFFCFFFVCHALDLEQRFSHSNILSPFVGQF